MNFLTLFQPLVTLLVILSSTKAQIGPVDPVGFNFIGRINGMHLNSGTNVLRGGTIVVNGINITVPDNLLVTLPSIVVAWSEMFNSDGTPNLPLFGTESWGVTIWGNIYNHQYIAGLIFIAQDQFQLLQGYISAIDTATGTITIGTADNSAGWTTRLNDPTGVYGLPYTDNPLWAVDPANPSIRSATGFPVCIPRSANDTKCPASNRPKDSNGKPETTWKFGNVASLPAGAPDPRIMVPLVVGDYVTFSATKINSNLYAIYSLTANLGIFTAPGTKPSYLTVTMLNYAIVDTQGAEIAETRATVFTTDTATLVNWYALDQNFCNSTVKERFLLEALPFTGAPAGRTIFRLGTTDASPPPRNVLFRSNGGTSQGPNGIIAGQFVQPVFTYIFPELINLGGPALVNSFEDIPYLIDGGGPYTPGNPLTPPLANPPIVGPLNPWPGPGTAGDPHC